MGVARSRGSRPGPQVRPAGRGLDPGEDGATLGDRNRGAPFPRPGCVAAGSARSAGPARGSGGQAMFVFDRGGHRDAGVDAVVVVVLDPGDHPGAGGGHRTPALPEALVSGREDVYLGWFYRTFGHRPDALTTDEIDEYLRTYTQPETLRAGFEYYRALPSDAADTVAAAARGPS